jgi:BASS family bile acid:Na+ symporter
MESSAITTIFLPLALGIIMLGLGLSLTLDDFKRVVHYPKAVIVGLMCQMIILPVLCWVLAVSFNLSAELAVGLMLLAASPGGPTANLYSHLSNGDVALNISLTAVNSLLSLFTLPLIVNFSIGYFMEADMAIPMQFKKVVEVFLIVLIPVSLGMLVHAKSPAISSRLTKPVKILSAVFLVLIIAAAIMKERSQVVSYFQQVGLAALLFNLFSMLLGYQIPRLLNIGKKQAIAIGMEIGIHNGTLAIYIALSVLGNSAMSIPPAIYSLIMFFTAAMFGYWVNRKSTTH